MKLNILKIFNILLNKICIILNWKYPKKLATVRATHAFVSKRFNVRKRPQERRLAVIWIQPRYYRSSLCTILPSAGVIVKDNGISRSDSGGGGVDDDR